VRLDHLLSRVIPKAECLHSSVVVQESGVGSRGSVSVVLRTVFLLKPDSRFLAPDRVCSSAG
jgi:hypothetical protein